MDKDKMLDYFNDREATLFRDELGSNARYHELLQKKLAAEDAHRKMVGEAAWKQYLQLDELCNELESVRYQAMYLAGADGASYEYYTDDGETKDYDKPEHFVQITLDADGNAKSNRATVKVEG